MIFRADLRFPFGLHGLPIEEAGCQYISAMGFCIGVWQRTGRIPRLQHAIGHVFQENIPPSLASWLLDHVLTPLEESLDVESVLNTSWNVGLLLSRTTGPMICWQSELLNYEYSVDELP